MNKRILKNKLKPIVSTIYGTLFANHSIIEDSLTIFCFHEVSDNPSVFSSDHDLSVTNKNFEFQVRFIKKHFNTITPDELLSNKIPAKAAMITFDDGFKSYFTNALPILDKYNLPSINFLNYSTIKGDISWSGLITYLCNHCDDFYEYVLHRSQKNLDPQSYHLDCSREIVLSYLKEKNRSFSQEVIDYTGAFANFDDIQSVSKNSNVYFGNHLFNHDVSLLLNDQELLVSFNQNDDALKKYSNYRSLFAFPFGQPDTSFSMRQRDLLFDQGADFIFTGCSKVNRDIKSKYLHRIPLTNFNNSESSIWFSILRNSL